MSELLSPFKIRDLSLKNRVVLSPMCQYSARRGYSNDWHFAHLARFGMGGFGTVIFEATAVSPEGRITYGDLGIWEDGQAQSLTRIVDFLHGQGAAAGIQLAHAGRKASSALWWRGSFNETEEEKSQVAFQEWEPVAPSAILHAEGPTGFKMPGELAPEDMEKIREAFVAGAARADEAGFDIVEVHAAHGYLLNQFLSPIGNRRRDAYGESLENRMRFPLSVIASVREVWPERKPLFVRISAEDGIEGGWTLEDSLVFAEELKKLAVDIVVCSSGGFDGARFNIGKNYQVPLARRLRKEAGMGTMAVGLITKAQDAEAIIAGGSADMVALAREALDDPNWPLHARMMLGGAEDPYAEWPVQEGFAIRNKDRSLQIRGFSKS
ncbi:MAG: NADH:flavin oxidoreductase/NADH oxidase [Hyphomicrobiales bacterium]|nr:NADH:flavin oxidoreductase/NADH oxidase [Hyphomicrobiales bacterium]